MIDMNKRQEFYFLLIFLVDVNRVILNKMSAPFLWAKLNGNG